MHCRDLVELAALIAVHGPGLIRSGHISESALQRYWAASKQRLDRWSTLLNEYLQCQPTMTPPVVLHDAYLALAWRAIRPVLEEILASEVLTRVWTAVATEYDDNRGTQDVSPIVRRVLAGHAEARNRALNVLVYGRGISSPEAVELNRLRRRSERWCDMLLGYVVAEQPLEEFAFEPERVREFARDIRDELNRPLSPFSWQLVLSSLRAAFQNGLQEEAVHPELNQQIALSVLASFEADLFDFPGLLRSLWIERIGHMADNTESLIAELLSLDQKCGA